MRIAENVRKRTKLGAIRCETERNHSLIARQNVPKILHSYFSDLEKFDCIRKFIREAIAQHCSFSIQCEFFTASVCTIQPLRTSILQEY